MCPPPSPLLSLERAGAGPAKPPEVGGPRLVHWYHEMEKEFLPLQIDRPSAPFLSAWRRRSTVGYPA